MARSEAFKEFFGEEGKIGGPSFAERLNRARPTGPLDIATDVAGAIGEDLLKTLKSIPHLPAALMPAGGTVGMFDPNVSEEERDLRRRAAATAAMLLTGTAAGAVASKVAAGSAPWLLRALLSPAGIGAGENVVFGQLDKAPGEQVNPLVDAGVGAIFGMAGGWLGKKFGRKTVKEGAIAAGSAGTRTTRREAEELLAQVGAAQANPNRLLGGVFDEDVEQIFRNASPEVRAEARRILSEDLAEKELLDWTGRNPPPESPPVLAPPPTPPPMLPGQEEIVGTSLRRQTEEVMGEGLAEDTLRRDAQQFINAWAQDKPILAGQDTIDMANQILRERLESWARGESEWLEDATRRAARAVEGEVKSRAELLKGDYVYPARDGMRKILHTEASHHPTFKNRNQRLAFASEVLGRSVSSFSDLNNLEALNVVNAMRIARGESPFIPPTRGLTRSVSFGRRAAQITFPDSNHSKLFDLASEVKTELLSAEDLKGLAEAIGVPEETILPAAAMYHDFVKSATTLMGPGHLEMLTFQDFMEKFPILATRSRTQVQQSITDRIEAEAARVAGLAGGRVIRGAAAEPEGRLARVSRGRRGKQAQESSEHLSTGGEPGEAPAPRGSEPDGEVSWENPPATRRVVKKVVLKKTKAQAEAEGVTEGQISETLTATAEDPKITVLRTQVQTELNQLSRVKKEIEDLLKNERTPENIDTVLKLEEQRNVIRTNLDNLNKQLEEVVPASKPTPEPRQVARPPAPEEITAEEVKTITAEDLARRRADPELEDLRGRIQRELSVMKVISKKARKTDDDVATMKAIQERVKTLTDEFSKRQVFLGRGISDATVSENLAKIEGVTKEHVDRLIEARGVTKVSGDQTAVRQEAAKVASLILKKPQTDRAVENLASRLASETGGDLVLARETTGPAPPRPKGSKASASQKLEQVVSEPLEWRPSAGHKGGPDISRGRITTLFATVGTDKEGKALTRRVQIVTQREKDSAIYRLTDWIADAKDLMPMRGFFYKHPEKWSSRKKLRALEAGRDVLRQVLADLMNHQGATAIRVPTTGKLGSGMRLLFEQMEREGRVVEGQAGLFSLRSTAATAPQRLTTVGELTAFAKEKLAVGRRIKADILLRRAGVDPLEVAPVVQEGLWRSAGGDIPVKVLGTLGRKKGVKYLKIEGSKTGIPEKEFVPSPVDNEFNKTMKDFDKQADRAWSDYRSSKDETAYRKTMETIETAKEQFLKKDAIGQAYARLERHKRRILLDARREAMQEGTELKTVIARYEAKLRKIDSKMWSIRSKGMLSSEVRPAKLSLSDLVTGQRVRGKKSSTPAPPRGKKSKPIAPPPRAPIPGFSRISATAPPSPPAPPITAGRLVQVLTPATAPATTVPATPGVIPTPAVVANVAETPKKKPRAKKVKVAANDTQDKVIEERKVLLALQAEVAAVKNKRFKKEALYSNPDFAKRVYELTRQYEESGREIPKSLQTMGRRIILRAEGKAAAAERQAQRLAAMNDEEKQMLGSVDAMIASIDALKTQGGGKIDTNSKTLYRERLKQMIDEYQAKKYKVPQKLWIAYRQLSVKKKGK